MTKTARRVPSPTTGVVKTATPYDIQERAETGSKCQGAMGPRSAGGAQSGGASGCAGGQQTRLPLSREMPKDAP